MPLPRTAVLAQTPPGVDVTVTLGEGLAGGAVGAFLTTLLLGAVLVALFPDATERLMTAVVGEPFQSLAYGVFALFALVSLTVALVFSIVGIVVAIPLVVAAYLTWGVGSAVAFLAIADRLVGHEDGWGKPLLVAARMNGLLTLTGIGTLVAICVGAAGFGAVLRPYLE